MSCHDIGRGMNQVSKEVMTLYDAGEINFKAAKKLLLVTGWAVNWCDGNQGEAHTYYSRCTCGSCLKRVEKGQKLYSIYHISNEVKNYWNIDRKYELVGDRLCQECFDRILNDYCKDPAAGERERKYIESHYQPEEYVSEGEYSCWNNGYPWQY